MESENLTQDERELLLKLARKAIEQVVSGGDEPARGEPPAELHSLPPHLREHGASFVTLTLPDGELRGCIGGLEARQPLAMDVYEHAAAAAVEDYRFMPVRAAELPLLHIEISRLTPAMPLAYNHPEELPGLLHPYQDGVILRDGMRRATFLPQVWEKLPDPCAFLSHLCQKMGLPSEHWRRHKLTVEIYHVEEFHEAN